MNPFEQIVQQKKQQEQFQQQQQTGFLQQQQQQFQQRQQQQQFQLINQTNNQNQLDQIKHGLNQFSPPQPQPLTGIIHPALQTISPYPAQNMFNNQALQQNPSQSGLSQIASTPSTNLFANLVNSNTNNTPQGMASANAQPGIYTSINELTEEEIKEFRAEKFTLGKIPTNPPAREFC